MFDWQIIKAAVVLSAVAITASFRPAAAQNQESCNLKQEKFAELEVVQNDFGIDFLLRIRQELAVRKSLLKNVVDCATEELVSLQSTFDGAKTTSADVQALKSQFSGWFSGVINYYAIQKNSIDDLGLQGSKDFAKNFSVWREGNFKPTAKLISNFIVWAGNQDLIFLAQSRLNQVRRGIDSFGLTLNEAIRNGLAETETEFRKARVLDERARDALRAYRPADDSAVAIKGSLESLASAYKKLFDLVGKVNKAIAK